MNDKSSAKKKEKYNKKAADRRAARERRRHMRIYKLISPVARLIFDHKLNYSAEKAETPDGSCLILANHNTDLDFLLVGTRFRQHMYYVANEHIYQQGFASKLLKRYFSPIARVKGVNATSTVMTVVRTLRRGDRVCIFAEGNRAFNGLSCPILPSTGKLAKAAGAPLVTFRINGGYLTSPRWSYTMRKGRMEGGVVNIYTPEQLQAMSVEEVNDAIRRDLYEDAYELQSHWRVPYKGKLLAEGLEHALFMCPECGAIGRLHSADDMLTCECGAAVRYDSYGMLNGGHFDTISKWDAWQMGELSQRIADMHSPNELLFADDNVALWLVESNHTKKQLCCGRLSMSCRELSVGDNHFPIDKIEGLAVYGRANMVMTFGGKHYELKPEGRVCATKYLAAYEQLHTGINIEQ